jgi:hypothetical protein
MANYTTINKSTDYFNTKLYTGNAVDGSGTTQSVTGLDFSPNLVWIKSRSATKSHYLFDVVRGVNTQLNSNNANDENVSNSLTHFLSDGFTLSDEPEVNESGHTFVSWNWKTETSFTNDASATSIGTIDSTGSVSTDSGFSVISYTGNGSGGATVAHGLGSVPHMYIIKRRNANSSNWHVYHQGIGETKGLRLNLTNAESTTDIWNDTAPTNSVFSLGSSVDVNASGGTYIAYCFAEKTGYSKFGKYSANQNSDGPFSFLGFKPAFLMIKRLGTDPWMMLDNKRDGYNVTEKFLAGNASDSEATEGSSVGIDFLSNGFKCRGTSGKYNSTNSGVEYIYMAFAEAPLVGSNNVPCTAR